MRLGRKLSGMVFGLCVIMALLLPGITFADSGATLSLNYGYPGVEFQLYQVADEEKQLTEAFHSYEISLDLTTNAQWQALAIELEDLTEENHIAANAEKVTGEDGKVQFSMLSDGWYLVTGDVMQVGGARYKAVPFVVNLTNSVPVKADVKHSPVPDEPGGGTTPGGGSDSPSGPGTTPITDSDVPLGPGEGAEESVEIPLDEVPLFRLPQTGQLWWPVPILAAGGCFLLWAGIWQERKERAGYGR
mgnify:CR=1 FL=1